MITLDKYHVGLVAPDAKADGRLDAFWPILMAHADENGIDTDAEMIAFVASCLNETGLRAIEEASYINTPYEYIRREVFGSATPLKRDFDEWKKLGRKGFDEKFFGWVYDDANRPNGHKIGNPPGTGYLYRGRGINQITGYPNYLDLERETGLPLTSDPDILLTPEGAVRVAMRYWSKNNLNAIVGNGSEDAFLAGMRTMNPGLHDFSHHLALWRGLNEAIKKPVPMPTPETKTEAFKQVATGKTGAAVAIAALPVMIKGADALSALNDATATATAAKGFLALYGLPQPYTEIALFAVSLLAMGYVLHRYGGKLLRGEAVST